MTLLNVLVLNNNLGLKVNDLIKCLLWNFQEISSLSVEPCEGETLIVTVFEIKKSEV